MNVAKFAPTTNLFTKRAIIARKLQVRAFFMLHSQIDDIAVACTFEVKSIIPIKNFSLGDGFVVVGEGGNRFLICRRINNKSTMSKVTPFTKQEIFEGFAFEASAKEAAKHLRQTVIDALQNPDADLESLQRTLFLAELLQDIATEWAETKYQKLKNQFTHLQNQARA